MIMNKVLTARNAQLDKNLPLTFWADPFVEEIRQIRAKLMLDAGGSMHQLILNAQRAAFDNAAVK